jgi:hypothetical protein
MSKPEPIYGIASWKAWAKDAPYNLRDTRQTSREICTSEPYDVHTFDELFRVASFLNVMNKKRMLLFRGQGRDLPARPTIVRDRWLVPGGAEFVDLSLDRLHYWNALQPLCSLISRSLRGKLPRHAPFDRFESNPRLRVAPWSVIQHYELWPTPVVDLTSSLRVAASFALGLPAPRSEGFLYAYASPTITSDLMELAGVPDPITYRLSAVCPPSARRPHLQEGMLIGRSEFQDTDLNRENDFLDDMIVAKFRLLDGGSSGQPSFWSNEFPKFLANSLLPQKSNDELVETFATAIEYVVFEGKASWRRKA